LCALLPTIIQVADGRLKRNVEPAADLTAVRFERSAFGELLDEWSKR